MDLKTERVSIDSTDLAKDRDQCRAPVNTVMNILIARKVEKFLSSYTIGGFSRRVHVVS
jgi:hypothetical protein